MTGSASLPKKLIILGIALPLAILLGLLMATPDDFLSALVVGAVICTLLLPAVLRWHHLLLVCSLNAALVVGFLPGSPNIWMLMAAASVGITLLGRILDKNRRLLNVPSVTWPLLVFAAIVVLIAQNTGGMGLRALGSGVYGGKKYFFIWFAVLVYFAVSWVRTPSEKAPLYLAGYTLSGVTSMLSNLVFMAGPAAWILYYFIPFEMAMHQISEEFTIDPLGQRFNRLGGLAVAAHAAMPFLLIRYGAAGLLDYRRPWRMAAMVAIVAVGALGGFRSTVLFAGFLFLIHFFLEGLHRTRMFPALILAGLMGFAALIPVARHLPLSVQRSLSVLPIPVSEIARFDAEQSSRWRLDMWAVLKPEIPRYFWSGKGFTASATDYYLTQEMVRRDIVRDYESMILAGDYHNGPLSVLIPFGIWGMLAFVWFLAASMRVLYRNFQNGDPRLAFANTFLLAFFIAKAVFFFVVFGAIHLDILTFIGIVALSVSINGGIRTREQAAKASALVPVSPAPAPLPAGASGI